MSVARQQQLLDFKLQHMNKLLLEQRMAGEALTLRDALDVKVQAGNSALHDEVA